MSTPRARPMTAYANGFHPPGASASGVQQPPKPTITQGFIWWINEGEAWGLKDLFTACMGNDVTEVTVEDFYAIMEDRQMNIFKAFCWMLVQHCVNLKRIHLFTCDTRPGMKEFQQELQAKHGVRLMTCPQIMEEKHPRRYM
ncbi:hypothetical protein AAVH_06258 [Aphelenchoides avenae]|nr:hypothetical protein AAVH_06258 [Aphelenchus avenae]